DRAAGDIATPPHRIPARRRCGGYSKPQPSVPGEVFELHGAQKNCGIKTCMRIVGEVFDASGKIRIEVVAPHCIPDNSALTAAEQQGHQVALGIEPRCEFTRVLLHQTLICRLNALPYCLLT